MKQWTKLGGRLLALALVLCMGASLLPVAPVLAQEDSAAETTVADAAEPAEETEQAAPAEEQAAEESNSDDTTGGAVPADVAVSEENAAEGAESAVEVSMEPAGSVNEEDSTVEPEQPGSSVSGEDSAEAEDSLTETLPEGIEAIDDETAAPTEADAFGLEVSFAGQTLQEKTTNNISAQWDVTTAQSLQVALKRDTAVELEDSENKQYVLCLKTTEGFYFTTLPEIEKIDGAEAMEFVPNTAADGTELEPYSGEIRIQVDPEKNVNIGVLGVKVSDTVAAAAGTGLTVQSPVSVELVTADSSLKLKDIKDTDKTKVHGYSVDTAQLVDLTAVSTAGEEEIVPDGIEPIDEEAATGEEETVEPLAVDENAAFTVEVTFAENKLVENGPNNIETTWGKDNPAQSMNVVITRNKNVDVDPNRQYVLCMKTSDVFYFNGLPDISTITGAEDIAMIQNAVPKVNSANGRSGSLAGFSAYSGEIRVTLNPSVEMVTISDIGVSYNSRLMGYTNNTRAIENPVDVRLVSVASGKTLSEIQDTDKTLLHDYPVNTATVTTDAVGGGLRAFSSVDEFVTNKTGTAATIGVDDTITYVLCCQKQYEMVYKSLKVVLHVPYIEVGDEKHYLSLPYGDKDTAILSNSKKNNQKGYVLKQATYDEDAHTVTYEFENVYMTEWTSDVYTPTFAWPTDGLSKDIINNNNYRVKGLYWEVTEQTSYAGGEGSFAKNLFTETQATDTYFTAATPNIVLGTDYQPGSSVMAGIGKPMIYKDACNTGYTDGFLGFFDVHNEGAGDSPLVQIDIEFNDGKKKDDSAGTATYKVTQMYLPSDMGSSVTVSFTLEDTSGNTVSNEVTYESTSSFNCNVLDLRRKCNVSGQPYYIKSLSYRTKLKKSTWYHSNVMHSGRNYVGTGGVYRGTIEGDVGAQASATMTITPVETGTVLNDANQTKLSATEISTVSDLDFIADTVRDAKMDGQTSTNITAGSSTTLTFSMDVSTEEYPIGNTKQINGYHVFRDGVIYLCLPEGVSILNEEKAAIKLSNATSAIQARKVTLLKDTECTVNGTTAYWWEIQIPNINMNGYQNPRAEITVEFSTSATMKGVNWSFNNCIAVRAVDQQLSRSGNSYTTMGNSVKSLENNLLINKVDSPAADALVAYFKADSTLSTTEKLGVNLYRATTSTNLNIARAEAKLDVTTALSTPTDSGTNGQVIVSDADTEVTYAVTVTGTEGGSAKDFNYYIPIVHTNSTLDTGALVGQKEFSLELSQAVEIEEVNSKAAEGGVPFEVSYITVADLNSTTIQSKDLVWETKPSDFTAVTAVRISTTTNAVVAEGAIYRFNVVMKYNNTENDFDTQAGSEDQWRSFGHYTYTSTDGGSTTNSYPSGSNSVRIRYVKDLTKDPIILTLDTSVANNSTNETKILGTTFVKDQKLSVKEIKPSSGTVLTTEDPSGFTGADANSRFRMAFKINSGSDVTFPSKGNGWTVNANTEVNMIAGVRFSKALTDTTTSRYVDIVLGNDDINVTLRVQLNRKVTAASADNSGVVVGENFMVRPVSTSCAISKDSSFTALYVVENFVPGNFSSQVLKWQNSDGSKATFPAGTTITMMEISSNNAVTSYWYCSPSGSSVDLNMFTRMAGTGKYSYDTATTTATTLRYMFVVNFGQATADVGSYKLVLDADAKSGVVAFTPVQLGVTLGATKTYGLTATSTADVQKPTATVNYTVNKANGNDSYSEGRSLSLVLSSQGNTALPQDAQIEVDGKTYSCNGKNAIIIPIGTVATGEKKLTLKSQLFPEEPATYSFDAELYLSKSREDTAPMNGDRVAQCEITFTKSAENRPALSVTGTRVAPLSDWVSGQEIKISMANLENCTVTVTAYAGVNGKTQVTDLLSNVSGMFDITNGTGTYNGKESTGLLRLGQTSKAGTYRLSFEVTKDGETVMTVPYYIIVR